MIPQWKKDRCKWCAAGVRSAGATRQWHLPEGTSLMDATRCAAPTEADYIAELEARLKDSADDTARLDWLDETIRAAIDAARGAK